MKPDMTVGKSHVAELAGEVRRAQGGTSSQDAPKSLLLRDNGALCAVDPADEIPLSISEVSGLRRRSGSPNRLVPATMFFWPNASPSPRRTEACA